MCRGRLKEYPTAIQLLKTLSLAPGLSRETSSLVWNNLGVMEHRADKLETAHSCFLKAVSENPLNEQAQANLDKIESTMSGGRPAGDGRRTVGIITPDGWQRAWINRK